MTHSIGSTAGLLAEIEADLAVLPNHVAREASEAEARHQSSGASIEVYRDTLERLREAFVAANRQLVSLMLHEHYYKGGYCGQCGRQQT